jgi:hypothetical protein
MESAVYRNHQRLLPHHKPRATFDLLEQLPIQVGRMQAAIRDLLPISSSAAPMDANRRETSLGTMDDRADIPVCVQHRSSGGV